MGGFAGVEMRSISKSFGGNYANRDVDFAVAPGEVVGLLGENGAGKTTLMNILYGLYRPDSGTILMGGRPIRLHGPRDAIRQGIGMVHQHFMLVQNATVCENVVLGYDRAPFFFPRKAIAAKLAEFGKTFGLTVDPDAAVWQLSAGEQQRVEIVKALLYGAELLILDEPTSVLTPQEAEELFAVVKSMAAAGKSVILISHKMEEIVSVCSRVVILRKGAVSGEADPSSVDKRELARMMVGREIATSLERKALDRGAETLRVENLHVVGDRGIEMVRDISFSLYRNEIFGIAGVSGNGQRELVEAITGLRKAASGSICLDGEDISNRTARAVAASGISHVPEERIKFGIVPNLFVFENSVLKSHHEQPYSDAVFLRYDRIKSHAQEIVEDFNVATPTIDFPMKNLSGGNIQKLIIGREISSNPSLLVASHPTYGLDVGATEYIRRQLLKRRDEGGAVLLVSEDLEELFSLCDRIAVMYQGRFMCIEETASLTSEKVGLLMAGCADEGGRA